MKRARALSICVLLLLAQAAFAGMANARPLVVELFTSEGCASCPPADAYLRELAKRTDVLALSFHVDYWDSPNWKDALGNHAFTARQQAYNATMKLRGVYTPQMVIDGAAEGVGSRRADIAAKIAAHAQSPTTVPMVATREGDALKLKIAAGKKPASPATVWLLRYVKALPVTIRRGENAGRTITYVNVVRDMRPIGLWDGRELKVPLPRLGPGHYAALLQADKNGPMLGATRIEN
jgi:hypothetical protein